MKIKVEKTKPQVASLIGITLNMFYARISIYCIILLENVFVKCFH